MCAIYTKLYVSNVDNNNWDNSTLHNTAKQYKFVHNLKYIYLKHVYKLNNKNKFDITLLHVHENECKSI